MGRFGVLEKANFQIVFYVQFQILAHTKVYIFDIALFTTTLCCHVYVQIRKQKEFLVTVSYFQNVLLGGHISFIYYDVFPSYVLHILYSILSPPERNI